ncbi:MAG: hypothetical protein RJA59_413 [Pseudomonadota bacterium]
MVAYPELEAARNSCLFLPRLVRATDAWSARRTVPGSFFPKTLPGTDAAADIPGRALPCTQFQNSVTEMSGRCTPPSLTPDR